MVEMSKQGAIRLATGPCRARENRLIIPPMSEDPEIIGGPTPIPVPREGERNGGAAALHDEGVTDRYGGPHRWAGRLTGRPCDELTTDGDKS